MALLLQLLGCLYTCVGLMAEACVCNVKTEALLGTEHSHSDTNVRRTGHNHNLIQGQ